MTGARALSNIARIWLTTLACVIAAPRGGVPSPSTKIADIASKGADADGLRQAFERATYSLEKCGQGMWRGVNPAQQFTVEFKGGDVTLSHPDGGIAFHLTGYGYGSELRTPQRASLTGNGDFLTLNRGGLAEWYRNGPQGLEQGFTLSQRSGANSNSEPLVIALGFAGALRAVQNSYDGAIFLESGKGVVLRYGGLKAVDARGRVLPSRIEVRDQEIRLIVQDHDAQYPLVVDPIWSQQQELTASDGLAGDYFGQSVAVSGDTAVIGAYRQNGSQGAAYVFVRSGGAWSLQQKLTASDGQELDQFGVSVSVNGDTAVIGAYGRNFYQGAAYVFVRSGVTWTQQQELTASDSAVNDDFGISVSVNANTALIGAFGNNSSQGAAYVFVSGGGVWSQQQELSASDGAASDSFGDSVSVTGNTALIAADGKNSKQGAAYVFAYDGTTWSQQQELTASDGVASDSFGNSVSLGANVAVIGADGRGSNQGAAYVFGLSGGTWSQQQELSASDGVAGDQFGYAVSLSGYTALVGAPAKNNLEGAAYVFAFTAGVWSQQQELTASDGATSDVFGISVSASGNTALVGATGNNSSQGAAYAFVGGSLTISNLSPASAAPGGTDFTLTVNGSNFVSGATVMWDTTALSTTFGSTTQLTATVPNNLIATAGIATVTVVNPDSTVSNGVGFPIRSGPTAVSASPGGAGSSQTFTFTFSDPSGWQNLGVVDVLINRFLNGHHACYIAYSVPYETLYLVDDAGDAGGPFAGTMVLPGTGSVSNSQCTVNGAGSSAVGSGTTLTLTLNIDFSSSFDGNKVIYTAARDTGTGNSGWQALGTWGVPVLPTTVTEALGVTPGSGSGESQTYTFTFSDSNGWQDLSIADVLMNNFLNGHHACYIAYSVTYSTLYLVDDAGDAGGPFAGTMVLPGSGTISNSQCTVNGTGSSAVGSGNTLTLTLNMSFTGTFMGNRILYTAARNGGTANSGWQALGAWTVP
jgi:hypothetical protein